MQDVSRTVGRFEVIRRIGRGGMAVVYLARQRGLDRDVALKELRTFDDADASLAERFLREARVAGAMSHPNIVTVFDYFDEDGTPFIAMEYLPQGSLRPLIGRLTLAQALGVLEGVLAALSHAESHHVVHRDLKPENLLITRDGSIKVADFGIAKAYNQVSMGLTGTGMAIGTPTYMAPEQAMAKEVGRWTDLYAVGVVAYELLVGRVPFVETDTPLSILWQHVHDPVPSPRSLRPDLDPELADWLERMLAKAPAERPADAHEARESLEEIVVRLLGWRWRQAARLLHTDELPVAAPPPPPVEPTPPEPVAAEPVAEEPIAAAVDAAPLPPPPEAWQTPTEPPLAPEFHETHKSFEFPPLRRRLAIRTRLPGLAVAAVALGAAGVATALLLGRSDGPPPVRQALPDPVPSARERVAMTLADGSVFLSLPRGRLIRLDAATLAERASAADPATPTSVVPHAGALLVGERNGVARVDAETLRRLATFGFTRARVGGAGGAPLVVSGGLSRGRGRVCVLRAFEVTACAQLAFEPSGVGATRSGSVFAADRAGGAVVQLRLRGARLVPTRRIELGEGSLPHGALVPFLGRLYVAVRRGVAVVDLRAGTTKERIALGTTPPSVWIAPFNRRLFAPLYGRDKVAIVDLSAPHPRPTFVPVGKRPVAVTGPRTSSPSGRDVVYVVNAGDRTVSRLDAYTGAAAGSKRVPGLTGPDVPPLVARQVTFAESGRRLTATIRFSGGRFERSSVAVVDGDLSDGGAEIEIRQGAIASAVRTEARSGLTVRVVQQAGRLRLLFSAARGRFTRFDVAPGRRGRAIAVAAIAPPPTEVETGSGSTTQGVTTERRTGSGQQSTRQDTTRKKNCIIIDGHRFCS